MAARDFHDFYAFFPIPTSQESKLSSGPALLHLGGVHGSLLLGASTVHARKPARTTSKNEGLNKGVLPSTSQTHPY